MSEENLTTAFALSAIRGIRIIPCEAIPNGFRRTVGNDIFVSVRNYEYMKPLSAKGTIILLGFLIELPPEEKAKSGKRPELGDDNTKNSDRGMRHAMEDNSQ
jgi:hypothetical protein